MSDSSRRRFVTLKVPAELYQTISQLIEGSRFRSVSGFVIQVLGEVAGISEQCDEKATAPNERAAIQARLRSLGYID